MSFPIGHHISTKTRECHDCGTLENRREDRHVPIDIYLTREGKRYLCLGDLANRRLQGETVSRSLVP